MEGSEVFEKGSISFRVGKKTVAVVLARYKHPQKVIQSFALKDLEEVKYEIFVSLSKYRNGQDKWDKFLRTKLPLALAGRAQKARLLKYSAIEKVLDDIVWSMERHKAEDPSGSRGGKDLAVIVWKAWQSIRPIISKQWGLSEKAALGPSSES